jgi:hypothetical protein
MSLWGKAFDGQIGSPAWFVSEYDMPVPVEWRADIAFAYRCVDLACGDHQRLVIIELKTEPRSYRPDQVADYLRLVRHRNPGHATDVVLLGPLRPGYTPARGSGQRYAELTWDDVYPLLDHAFAGDDRAYRLGRFLELELLSPSVDPSQSPTAERDLERTETGATNAPDSTDTAVAHALRMAPSVAVARKGDSAERGIDVAFDSEADARSAIKAIKTALSDQGWDAGVSVWLWRPTSGGHPLTPAGAATGIELRLAPKLADRRTGAAH